jgi:chorismate mutase
MQIEPLKSWMPQAGKPFVVAGPCSAESEEQVLQTARALKATGLVHLFRAGVWKPRTRPNSFEGVGELALPWLQTVKKEVGMLTATEVASAKHVELCLKHGVDVLWIGARSTVNPFTVQEIADALSGVDIPVMVKNPINADLQLWIGALERLNQKGIKKLVAIHRGFSVAEKLTFRNSPLWRIPMELKVKYPDLPLICDPSHITGDRELVESVCQKAMDLDMDGLIIETHPHPEKAWSDASQQVTPEKLVQILKALDIKSEFSPNQNFDSHLEEFRRQIDRLDNELLHILSLRSSVVEKIAHTKVENSVTALQRHRFDQLMKERLDAGKELKLDTDYVKEIFDAIHEQSIKEQTDYFNKLKK